MGTMKQDYQTVTQVTDGQVKSYLLSIGHQYIDELIDFMSIQKFYRWFQQPEIKQYFYIQSLKALYQSHNYDEMEYHLIMMNQLYDYDSYLEIKEQLFYKLTKKTITINEYCVLRHLFPFTKNNLIRLLNQLYNEYGVSEKECARICLLENQYHLAYQYLLLLDDCDDEKLLDVLCHFSLRDYVSLLHHYSKKDYHYQWAMGH